MLVFLGVFFSSQVFGKNCAALRSIYQKIRNLQQWIKEDLKTKNENK